MGCYWNIRQREGKRFFKLQDWTKFRRRFPKKNCPVQFPSAQGIFLPTFSWNLEVTCSSRQQRSAGKNLTRIALAGGHPRLPICKQPLHHLSAEPTQLQVIRTGLEGYNSRCGYASTISGFTSTSAAWKRPSARSMSGSVITVERFKLDACEITNA